MKRIVLVAVLALVLPLSAFSASFDFTNYNGGLTGNNASLQLGNSALIQFVGAIGTDLGSVSFMTSPLEKGSLAGGATFNSGGTFTITLNERLGQFPAGVIFTGFFASPVTWVPESNGIFQLSGVVCGSLIGGNVCGFTTQLYVGAFVGQKFYGLAGGGNTFIYTPEPGTLGMLGTGVIGLAGVVRRRKLKA